MKTKHYDIANAYDRNCAVMQMEHLAKEIGKRNAHHIRLIEQGGGFAILPDTNRLADIGEKEFAKAFHLGEIQSTDHTSTPEKTKVILTYTDFDDIYIALTEDQYRLLCWLKKNEFLASEANFVTVGNEFEEI